MDIRKEIRGMEEENLFFEELDFSGEAQKEVAGFIPPEEGEASIHFEAFWKRYAKKQAQSKLRFIRIDKLEKAKRVYEGVRALAKDHYAKMSIILEQKGLLWFRVYIDHPLEVYLWCEPGSSLPNAIASADEFHVLPVDRYSVELALVVHLMGEIDMPQ